MKLFVTLYRLDFIIKYIFAFSVLFYPLYLFFVLLFENNKNKVADQI